MSDWSVSRRNRQFDEVLRDGITAAKTGQRALAQRLLQRAIMLDATDPRPYVWLSATTDNPQEQKDYLEQALAIAPDDISARRGLALLTGIIDPVSLLPEDENGLSTATSSDVEQVQERSFQCRKCGGRMVFSVDTEQLICEYCGFFQSYNHPDSPQEMITPLAQKTGQVLDFILPTIRGHTWAQGQHCLSCGLCGAVSILALAQKTAQCPYCGANQFIVADEPDEWIDPHSIILMKIDENQALDKVRQWLGHGIFTPDNLVNRNQGLHLRPAYYSFWVFDGTLQAHWSCEISVGRGSQQRWETRNGIENRLFKNVLASGVRSLPEDALSEIEPFDLAELQEFKPEHIAGWSAVINDRSLSDASLLAREKVMKRLHPELYSTVEIGCERRHIDIGSGEWSDMTFKHLFLPLWTGQYCFQGQDYQVLVNGQTGKVSGNKPRDRVKLIFSFLIILLMLVLIGVVYWLFFANAS
jgi:hypothetical protein